MTFGTKTIPKVYKIFGPGNQFVTVAKQKATQFGIAIDMPAGPSELLILADESANISFIASDLLSQAEHGSDSQVILISTSKTILYEVEAELKIQIQKLPRKEIAKQAIANSKLIYVENDALALDLINEYGPEHLIICCTNESFFVDNIENAGSVFIGNFTTSMQSQQKLQIYNSKIKELLSFFCSKFLNVLRFFFFRHILFIFILVSFLS